MDTALAAYATDLRRRILSPTADAILPPADHPTTQDISPTLPPHHATAAIRGRTLTTLDPHDIFTFIAHLNRAENLHEATWDASTVTADEPGVDQFGIREREQRIERWRADYHHYVRQLAEHHADQLLYRALPVVIHHQAQQSFYYDQLLATIALADAHGLDTASLITAIATNDQHDLGASLLTTRDPTVELRTRADRWIHTHAADPASTHLNGPETLPTADVQDLLPAIAHMNIPAEVLYHDPTPAFHALKDLPYTGLFRPIPDYPDRNESLAEYATLLRDRIENEQHQLSNLINDTPPRGTEQAASEHIPQSASRRSPPPADPRAQAKARRRSQLNRQPGTSHRTRRSP